MFHDIDKSAYRKMGLFNQFLYARIGFRSSDEKYNEYRLQDAFARFAGKAIFADQVGKKIKLDVETKYAAGPGHGAKYMVFNFKSQDDPVISAMRNAAKAHGFKVHFMVDHKYATSYHGLAADDGSPAGENGTIVAFIKPAPKGTWVISGTKFMLC